MNLYKKIATSPNRRIGVSKKNKNGKHRTYIVMQHPNKNQGIQIQINIGYFSDIDEAKRKFDIFSIVMKKLNLRKKSTTNNDYTQQEINSIFNQHKNLVINTLKKHSIYLDPPKKKNKPPTKKDKIILRSEKNIPLKTLFKNI